MPKKRKSSSSHTVDVETDATEMREIPESELGDAMSYDDSGHASDAHSHESDDDADSDDRSDASSITINDPKELMKKLAKERLRKCVLFINQFGKLIQFLIQTGIVGGTGLLAYYMEFQDIFPRKHTVFNCDDQSINQTFDTTVFEHFIFGENIDEQWIFLFSLMAPPGFIIVVEFLYMLSTGCILSHHFKTPLILRRIFRYVGNYFFGVMCCLAISKTVKLFLATPRPYFMNVCQPEVEFCFEATEAICTNTNVTALNDARTSFPSMSMGALSFACVFMGVYIHQMIRNSKAFVLQPLFVTLFFIISLLGACIELGVKRSHWYDVLAGYVLGTYLATHQVVTLNLFVENFQPPLPVKREETFMQTDPMPEPESDDEYPYDDIMMGKLPKRKKREEGGETNIPCFHRATSFDNTFQSDMARSMKMFKNMSAVWTSDQLPSLGAGSGYDQGLPQVNEENTTRVEIQPPSPKSISSKTSDTSQKKRGSLSVPSNLERRGSSTSTDSGKSGSSKKSPTNKNRLRVDSETKSSPRRTSVASNGSSGPKSPTSTKGGKDDTILEVHMSPAH